MAVTTSTSRAMPSCGSRSDSLLRPPSRRRAPWGARVSIDLSSWSAIRDFGPERFRALIEELTPDVVFANEAEDEIIGGPLEEVDWILKRGAGGASFAGAERAAVRVETVVDSTGAGDAFAAGWLVGGPELALVAAARCVQRAGSMPAPTPTV